LVFVKFWTRLIYHLSYAGPSPGSVGALVGGVIILGQPIRHVAGLSGPRGHAAASCLAVRRAGRLTALAAAADGEEPATRGAQAQTPNIVLLLRHGLGTTRRKIGRPSNPMRVSVSLKRSVGGVEVQLHPASFLPP